MNNVLADLQHANPIPVDQPWGGGFGDNSLLRTIGMIVLVVFGVFQIISCLFEILRECFGEEIDDHGMQAQPNARNVIQLQIAPPPAEKPIAGMDLAIVKHANLDAREKLQEAVNGYRINEEMLSKTPPSIEHLLQQVLKNDVSEIQIEELLTIFDACFGIKGLGTAPRSVLDYINLGQRNVEQRELLDQRSALDTRYVQFIKKAQEGSAAYHKRLDWLAKNIIFELRKEKVSFQAKQTVLLSLADAAANCKPRRLEESQMQLLSLIGAKLDMKDKFLLWAQQVKEAIIIKQFQGSQFHVINHARYVIGEKWGLNTDPVNLNDEHLGCGAVATAQQYDNALRATYTPEHLIEEIYGRLVYDGDAKGAMEFLKDDADVQESMAVMDGKYFEFIEDPSSDAVGAGVSIVTRQGVAKIAERIGLITPAPKREGNAWGMISSVGSWFGY